MNATEPGASTIASYQNRLEDCQGINDTVAQAGDPTYQCYGAGQPCELDDQAIQICGDNNTCVCGAHKLYLADVSHTHMRLLI